MAGTIDDNVLIRFGHNIETSRGDRINDGKWHQVTTTIGWPTMVIYMDGTLVNQSYHYSTNHDQCSIILGEMSDIHDDSQGDKCFKGEITQLNVYGRLFSTDEIVSTASSCTQNAPGEIVQWVTMDNQLTGDVIKQMPSSCGSLKCPDGYTGKSCETEIDKIPPEVLFCPNDTWIINSKSRLSVGEWEEPIFTDNVEVINVTKSYRIGTVFAWGQYLVAYVAADASGNTAMCIFTLYVLPAISAASNLQGSVAYPSAQCDEDTVNGVISVFKNAMVHLDAVFGICGDGGCIIGNNVRAVCGTGSRKKRQVIQIGITIEFTIPSNSSVQIDTSKIVAEAVKDGSFDTVNITADSNSLIVERIQYCQLGQILVGDLCVNCGLGEFHNTTTDQCVKCPKGSYQDKERQLSCQMCPNDTTTQGMGSTSIEKCFVACDNPGEEQSANDTCVPCPHGSYRSNPSTQPNCAPCPFGYTTEVTGATSEEECLIDEDECKSGNDKCDEFADCINSEGSYRCICQNGYQGDGFTCNGYMKLK
ncbi:uncharacterized protein [Ptychodera flava]|uniref:uncharacterized protein n=1 Tax=Ptychodera flava TaxID=63121 RepID=UPI00396AA03F